MKKQFALASMLAASIFCATQAIAEEAKDACATGQDL